MSTSKSVKEANIFAFLEKATSLVFFFPHFEEDMNRNGIDDQNNDDIIDEPQNILEEDVEDDDDDNNRAPNSVFFSRLWSLKKTFSEKCSSFGLFFC